MAASKWSASVRRSTPDSRIGAALFLLVFVTYSYFFAGGGWNQNAQFDLTRAIVENRSFAIDQFAWNTGDLAFHEGRTYANKAPGASFLAAVPYAVVYNVERWVGADTESAPIVLFNAYVCTVVVSGGLGAMIPLLVYAIARASGRGRPSSAALAVALAFATPLLPYSTLLMAHVPSAALLFASYVALRARQRFASAGALAGVAAVTNYLLWPAVALMAVYAALGAREARRRALLRFGLGVLPPAAILAFYQQAAFGGIFRTSIEKMDPRFVSDGAAYGILGMPTIEALIGVTVSPYRGLFYTAPLLLLAIPGLVAVIRSREWRLDGLLIAAIGAYVLLFNISFNGWEGGFGISARYLVVLIPFMGVAMIPLLDRVRPVWVALTVVSFLNCFAATAVDPQPSGSIPRPLEQYVYPLLLDGSFSPRVPITPPWSAQTFTGHTSVNRHSILEAVPFQLFSPGTPMSEWASFNLGETFTAPGSALSLAPILLFLATGALILRRLARRAEPPETSFTPGAAEP